MHDSMEEIVFQIKGISLLPTEFQMVGLANMQHALNSHAL
jgi:hypothetical protein